MDLSKFTTEGGNPASSQLDMMSALELVTLINTEDRKVAPAVGECLPEIARAVDLITAALEAGGRLIYVGAGTSGRLGVLDASECPPTYGVCPETVQGLMAGGMGALLQAKENAEDSLTEGPEQLRALDFSRGDVLCAIAASGRTPYCLGAMEYAHTLGAQVIAVTCNKVCPMAEAADIALCPQVGPEVVSGSTRMKSGTAQKMVLNMLTTASMVRLGKVYGPYMVDLKATNEKLRVRSQNIVMQAASVGREEAISALEKADGSVKLALAMLLTGMERADAEEALRAHKGRLRELENCRS